MLDLIKKNWVILLVVIIALVAIRFLWPDESKVETPLPSSQPATVEQEKQEPVSPEPLEPGPSVTAVETPLPEKRKEEFVEEVYEEEDDVPEKRNFVLCEHIVSGESRYEFTGQIRLINKGSEPIYGWTVYWEYEDGSTIIEASDVALAGNNPYTGQYLPENAEIAPGKTVTFSFTGVKGGDTGPSGIEVKGNFCM